MALDRGDRIVFPKSSTLILSKDPDQKEASINRIKKSGKEYEIKKLGIRYFPLKKRAPQPIEKYLEDKNFQNFNFPISNYPEEIRNVVQTDILWKKIKYYHN